MVRPLKHVAAFLWIFVVALRWLKLQVNPIIDWFTESILGGWEEGTKSFIRESFTNTTRFLNGFFSWCLAFFVGKEHYKTMRGSGSRTRAWQSWWQEDRQSTLNAFIATHAPKAQGKKKPRVPTEPAPVKERKRAWWQEWGRQLQIGGMRWFRGFSGSQQQGSTRTSSGRRKLTRRGSDLFDRPSGYAVDSAKRGLVEDVRMWIEIGVTRFFDFFRYVIRRIFFLPPKGSTEGMSRQKLTRHNTAPLPSDGETWEEAMAKHRGTRFDRRKSLSSWEGSLNQTTAGDAIHAAGYPLQIHTVTTPDGYVMQMERIPRPGVREVVFFMHGILDTSMGWVANGTGSHAFAAYDQGMDVWLGSSRSNPPRTHIDPRKHGTPKYWHYSVNELGMEDCLAQLDHIHFTKCQELNINAGPPPTGLDRPDAVVVDSSSQGMRRSTSDSALPQLQQECDVPHQVLQHRHSGERTRQASAPPAALATDFEAPPERRRRPSNGRVLPTQSERRPRRKPPTSFRPVIPNGNASLMNGATLTSHQIENVPEEIELVPNGNEESPSPRMQDSDESSSGDEEISSRPRESAFQRRAYHGSMSARDYVAADRSQLFQDASASLSPDRTSHDGVEISRPSATPSSRARDAQAERRAVDALQQQQEGPSEPYRLRAVGHSLGGAALLIYAVMSRRKGRRHHIYRLILLTPAGFLQHAPKAALPFIWFLPLLVRALNWLRPGSGAAVLIPSTWLRYITFKLTADLQSMPALQELTKAGIRLLLNGDASQWDRAMQMPHYNPTSMPAISLHTGMHLAQWVRSGKFRLYDYGSAASNRQHYDGDAEPFDIAGNYRLLDCPVDIMAGRADGIIARENVQQHYERMKDAGCSVTYKEFDFGHLDFTFALKEELVYYVRSRLRLRH